MTADRFSDRRRRNIREADRFRMIARWLLALAVPTSVVHEVALLTGCLAMR
jgi:hypothetical protein